MISIMEFRVLVERQRGGDRIRQRDLAERLRLDGRGGWSAPGFCTRCYDSPAHRELANYWERPASPQIAVEDALC